MDYRADVDGLRGVAVLLVVFFHAGVMGISSGFIGVDIFFVISGYLIYSLVSAALAVEEFKLSEFYARRLWRLQPAMIAVMVFCLVVALIVYLPDDFLDFLKSAKYSSLFIANQYFDRVTNGYAAPDSSHFLILHLWSLSIEWQWYILMPVATWLLYRYFSPGARSRAIIFITIIAIGSAMFVSMAFPEKGYFLLTSRAFEFMTGVVSATLISTHRFQLSHYLSSVLSFISLAVLLWLSTRDGILPGFPNYYALIVCVATGWLLYSGAHKNYVAQKFLSCKPLVFVGLRSYSLYLWHWPVLAIASYLGMAGGWLSTTLCLLITCALACLGYIGIERKFRSAPIPLGKTLLILVVLPAVIWSIGYSLAKMQDGFSGRFGINMTSVDRALSESKVEFREWCLGTRSQSSDINCTMGALETDNQSLLIGDSYSNQYWGFLDILGKAANTSFLVHGTSSCLALPNIYLYDWWVFKGRTYDECHDNAQKYYALIQSNHYRYVVIGQAWPNYEGDNVIVKKGDPRSVELSRARIESSLAHALKIISASGAIPVVIKAPATMPENFATCSTQHLKLRGSTPLVECTEVAAPAPGWFDALFERLKASHPELVIIDPKDVQCAQGQCLTFLGDVPVYRDVGHITDFASYMFGRRYLERFGNPLK